MEIIALLWKTSQQMAAYGFSSKEDEAPIKINQDANIYSLELDKGNEISFPVEAGRQAYLVQIEGNSTINGITLDMRDALEIVERRYTNQSQ